MGAVVTPSSSSSIDPVPVSSPAPSSSIHPSLPQEQTTQTQLLPQHCHHHHQESNFLPQNSLPEKHTKHSFVFALHATRLLPRPCSPAAPQNSSLVSRHLPISPTRTTAVESECPFFGFALRIHLLIRRRVPPPTTTTLTCFYCIGFAHSQLCYSQRTVSELYNSLSISPFQYFPLDKDDDGGNRNPPAPRERVRCRLELIPDQGVTAASTAADLQSLPDPFLHPQPSSELDFVFFFFSDRHRDTNATRARPGMIAGCADH